VMQHFGERVFCKVGAEGVYCAALPTRGLGIAIKVDDGNTARAAEVVMASVIEALAQRDDADAALLHDLVRVPLRNWNGIEVGSIAPAEALKALA
jgi:L-asparaginase II